MVGGAKDAGRVSRKDLLLTACIHTAWRRVSEWLWKKRKICVMGMGTGMAEGWGRRKGGEHE